jgi:hypothetical protein
MNGEAEWQAMARSGAISAAIRLLSKEPGQSRAQAYSAVYQWLDENCPEMLPDVACLEVCERVDAMLKTYAEKRSIALYYLLHVLSPRETVETMLAHTVVMVSRGGDPWVDLAIEVVTADSRRPQIRAVVLDHLKAGVRLVWTIDPEDRSVTIIVDPLESRTLEADATLDGGDVLPGFSCKVSDLFA